MTDYFTKQQVSTGCRCVLLSKRLYLNHNIGLKRINIQNAEFNLSTELILFASKYGHFPYTKNLRKVISSWYDGPGTIFKWMKRRMCCYNPQNMQNEYGKLNNTGTLMIEEPLGESIVSSYVNKDNNELFCTQLVAKALIETNIITRKIKLSPANANNYILIQDDEYTIMDLLLLHENYDYFQHIVLCNGPTYDLIDIHDVNKEQKKIFEYL